MARYGNIKTPFKENDILNPVDPYGVAKVAAENILKILKMYHQEKMRFYMMIIK